MNEDRDQPHGVIEMMENDIPLAGPDTTIGQIVVFTEDVLNADETWSEPLVKYNVHLSTTLPF